MQGAMKAKISTKTFLKTIGDFLATRQNCDRYGALCDLWIGVRPVHEPQEKAEKDPSLHPWPEQSCCFGYGFEPDCKWFVGLQGVRGRRLSFFHWPGKSSHRVCCGG